MGGKGGHVPLQVLGYQLSLFGPRGQIMPAILLLGPLIFLDDAASLPSRNSKSLLNLIISAHALKINRPIHFVPDRKMICIQ